MSIKRQIRDLAIAHGFDLCHFTRPLLGQVHVQGYSNWLDAGMYGDMAYMAEEVRAQRRQQPESMLKGVRSIITVAMRYTPPPYTLTEAEQQRNSAVIASYAHGDDYHDAMKKRLKALARDLDGLLGAHDQRVYVDTAPVLEHAFAESAGLGWQGKHSLSIHRHLGSWFLLGELFTTAALEEDASAINHCGSCRACMDICPTRAIVAPYTVDARLCISYLTIEYKGFIPHALRPLFGNRIYGCDDCQMVCPWNQKVDVPTNDILRPRGENLLPELASLLQLDDVAFRKRFAKSPIKRTGRDALLRNVCIAMGNSGHREFVPVLLEVLMDDAALVRAHALWALVQLAAGDQHIHAAIREAVASEKDWEALEDMNITCRKIRINNE